MENENSDITSPIEITAYHISDSINLKQFKSDFTGKLLSNTLYDLFFSIAGNGYLYVFNYGVVAFANVSEVDQTKTLEFIKRYSQNPVDVTLSDNFRIQNSNGEKLFFDFDNLSVPIITTNVIKIIMFNVAQSVALDYYDHESETLLERVNSFTAELEMKGRISISKKNMLKFIGKTLSRKNRAIDNLYIFDVPDIVWEDKYLDEINSGIVRIFDLKTRFKEVQSNFKNIEDNLSFFMELYQHRMSNLLEWIIIILILIEVIDLFISKLKLL